MWHIRNDSAQIRSAPVKPAVKAIFLSGFSEILPIGAWKGNCIETEPWARITYVPYRLRVQDGRKTAANAEQVTTGQAIDHDW
jgi:hypothetical protein